jgi:hypothetical protein
VIDERISDWICLKVKNFESFTPYKQVAWELVESLWSRLLPAQIREKANGIAEDSDGGCEIRDI